MSTIGSRIRHMRLMADLSVDELAARLGKNRATIYRYESDEIENFPIAVIGPLAEALQTTPAYLMGWNHDDAFISNEEKPAPDSESGLDAEIINLLLSLPEEKKAEAINYLRYLAKSAES